MEPILNQAQKEVIDECVARRLKTGGLSLPLGFGKTRTSICLSLQLSKSPALIVVSKTLLASWLDEIQKAFGSGAKYEILHRSYLKDDYDSWVPNPDTQLVLTTPDVMVDAYTRYHIDSLTLYYSRESPFAPEILEYISPKSPILKNSTVQGIGSIYKISWGTIIIDEIQKYTEVTTNRCRAIAGVYADYRWGLSGTMFDEPKMTRILGFMVMLHLDGPRRLPDMVSYISDFRGLDQYLVKRDKNAHFTDAPEYVEQIVSHRLEAPEVVIFQGMREILKSLSTKVSDAKRRGDTSGVRKYNAYKLAMLTYMRQSLICPMLPLTSMYCDMADFKSRTELAETVTSIMDKQKIKEYIDDEKNILSSRLRSVLEKIQKHKGEKCVVFSSFRTVVDLLIYFIREQQGRNVMTISATMSINTRQKTIAQFEKSDCGVLVIPYDIGAEGLNLQCASVVMLVDLWWNSAKTNQAIGRIYRPGQKALKVHVYLFVSDTFIEQKIIEKNTVKQAILSQLQTGSADLKIPKIDMKLIMEMIELEENNVAITRHRSL